MASPAESLLTLNSKNAKYLEWVVRVVHGQLVEYHYKDKAGSQVKAIKFICCLVGQNPSEYVQGCIRHNPSDPSFVTEQRKRFADGSVWRLKDIHLLPSSKPEYNGAPNKSVVLLEHPSQMQRILQGTPDANATASYVLPPLQLTDIMQINQGRLLDAAVFIEQCAPPRMELVKGTRVSVATAKLADATCAAEVSCWGSAASAIHKLSGTACVVIGMWAQPSSSGVKLTIRESALIDGSPNAGLKALCLAVQSSPQDTQRQSVTAVWVPSQTGKSVDYNGDATLSCAAIVDLIRSSQDMSEEVFQLMGVRIEASSDKITTSDGSRLYMIGTLRDWSGSCTVGIVEDAVIQLFGCASKDEVAAQHQAGRLLQSSSLYNIRGVIRNETLHVGLATPSDAFQAPTDSALKLSELVGWCGPFKDGILPSSLSQIRSNSLLNLGVDYEASEGGVPTASLRAPHQVMMLVQGSEKTSLLAANGTPHARVLVSHNVVCLLDLQPAPSKFTLRCVSHEDHLLESKLDARAALVWINAVLPGSPLTLVASHIQPVEKDDVETARHYIQRMMLLSKRPRADSDSATLLQNMTPQSGYKKAKVVRAWPSDPLAS
jgi:hypothetical protein